MQFSEAILLLALIGSAKVAIDFAWTVVKILFYKDGGDQDKDRLLRILVEEVEVLKEHNRELETREADRLYDERRALLQKARRKRSTDAQAPTARTTSKQASSARSAAPAQSVPLAGNGNADALFGAGGTGGDTTGDGPGFRRIA